MPVVVAIDDAATYIVNGIPEAIVLQATVVDVNIQFTIPFGRVSISTLEGCIHQFNPSGWM